MKRLPIISLVVLAFFILVSPALLADTIEFKDGKLMTRVKIQKEGLLKVEYKKPGLPLQYVDSVRVKAVKYDNAGNEYKTAREAFGNESYLEAGDLFQAVSEKSDHRPVFRAHCLFRAAESYQRAGDWKSGIQGFTIFANEFKDHRLFPDSLKNRAICFLNNREPAKAKKAFAYFQKKVGEAGLPDFWKYESAYWMVYIQEGENATRALRDYNALYQSTKASFPTIANKARLRIGRVHTAEKKFKEALALFNEIIDNRDPDNETEREVISWAYLSRGYCVMMMPKKGDAKEEYTKVLYDMLRCVVHYPDVGSTQAEAMYWAGKCFQHLGGKESTKKWQSLFVRIQREWPGSRWAQEAAKELGM